MSLLIESFRRALDDCLHTRILALTLTPLLIMLAVAVVLGYFYWNPALAMAAGWLDSSSWMSALLGQVQRWGWGDWRRGLAPVMVLMLATPIIVVLALLLVSWLMVPVMLRIVTRQHFPALERLGEASLWRSAFWSLGNSAAALLALLLSIPLWFIPPLILIVPPVIWGWLTYRVMSYDALDVHASTHERRQLMSRHKLRLLTMGVVTGYLSAAPALVWASALLFAVGFVVLIPVAIWIYTVVFAFSALWFAHYCLAALTQERAFGTNRTST